MSSYLFAILCVLNGCLCESGILRDELSLMNEQLLKLNSISSHLAWTEVTQPDQGKKLRLVEVNTEWRHSWCRKLLKNYKINVFGDDDEYRQFYLLCRGPSYGSEQARELSETLDALRRVYRTKICRKDGSCLSGERDLENLMERSRDPEELLWAWIEWRNNVGEASKDVYIKLVELLNIGAKNNGYNDIGECWKEELETNDPERLAEKLYSEVKSLYVALHAVVRYKLNRYYGSDLVSLNEGIPSDLLGSLWGQNWGSLIDMIVDMPKSYNITASLRRRNYTVTDLVKRSEDFYVSLGFRPMTEEFWKNSKFVKDGDDDPVCHGSAVNMFRGNDFRMLLCADVTSEDFQVINHEMGHVQYYAQYQHQPAIFQEGTNPAFQEAIGGAVFYGIMTPNHLQRLGLIPEVDDSSGIDLRLLLEQALYKLPQIPFALALEKWRWGVFRGDIAPEDYNKAWWFLREKYQGVKPPVPRSEEFFDPAAVFHVNDNVPYISYFFSTILEVQIFESLCNGTFTGYEMNKTVPIQLHRCDIYGSKEGAKKLRSMMSLGRRIHWTEALKMVTGETDYSTRPLLNYYRPLYKWLIREIVKYRIPVGW
ncbi:UNVERIFIED_CONTAM: hypothetical protein PYX00_010339 [Menopon gallinae]|uniref:Angiotensin-converting enzyme n=1 Tax=Menopon gallinae TaxID=328185 RepID=A0AAW2HF37_9NEOP